jgi:hypothetical protein
MTKKIVFLALCSLLLAPCSPGQSQQPKKVPWIGYLASAYPASESLRSGPIRQALREPGYIEGKMSSLNGDLWRKSQSPPRARGRATRGACGEIVDLF